MPGCCIRYFVSSSSSSSSNSRGPSEDIPISRSTLALSPASSSPSPSPSASKDALILLTLFQIPTALLTFGLTAGSFYLFSRSGRTRGLASAAATSAQDGLPRSISASRTGILKRLENLETLSYDHTHLTRQLEERISEKVDLIKSSLLEKTSIGTNELNSLKGDLDRIEAMLKTLLQTTSFNRDIKSSGGDSSPPSGGIAALTKKQALDPIDRKESLWEVARDSSPFLYGQHSPIESAKSPVDSAVAGQSVEDHVSKYMSPFRPAVQPSDETPSQADVTRWSSLMTKKKNKRDQNPEMISSKAEIKRARREAEEEDDRIMREEKEWKAQKRGWTKDLEPEQNTFVLVDADESNATTVSPNPAISESHSTASDISRADQIDHEVLPKKVIDVSKPTNIAQSNPPVASEVDPLPAPQAKHTKSHDVDRSSTVSKSSFKSSRSDSFPDSSPDGALVAAPPMPKPVIPTKAPATVSVPKAARPCFMFGLQPHSMASAFGFRFERPHGFKHKFGPPFVRAETVEKERRSDKTREHEGLPLGEIKAHGQGCSYWTFINGVRVRRVSSYRK